MGPVIGPPVARVADALADAPVLKLAGNALKPLAVAVKSSVRVKPVGGVAVKFVAASWVALIETVDGALHHDPEIV